MSNYFKCPNCKANIEAENVEYLQCKECGKRYKNPKYQPEVKAVVKAEPGENTVNTVKTEVPVQNAVNAEATENRSEANANAKDIAYAIFKAENSLNAPMTENQKGELLRHFSYYLPKDETINFLNALNGAKQDKFALLMSYQPKSPLYTSLFAIFGAMLGMDRFYIGKKSSAIAKIIFGAFTFGIWYLVDIFKTYKKCRQINLDALYALLGTKAEK